MRSNGHKVAAATVEVEQPGRGRPPVSRESSVYSISLHDSQSELIRTWHRLAKSNTMRVLGGTF
ncbi:hypothetical protein ZHAS_00015550 [Anopheles sinensis]|uniref:Uncharacterized protein n=1 Tax=Anopheles sinensis TaxID=74873 RepID=A0A084WBI8_ANOSI|nr:hypothetical protein ZHAS_00015550 [Anopheles sinensis]